MQLNNFYNKTVETISIFHKVGTRGVIWDSNINHGCLLS